MNEVWTQPPDAQQWTPSGNGPARVTQLLEQLRRDVAAARQRMADPYAKTLEAELRLIGRGREALARIDAGGVPEVTWDDLVAAAEATISEPDRGYQLIVPAELLGGLTGVPEKLRSSAGAPIELMLSALMPSPDTILAVPTGVSVSSSGSVTSLTARTDPDAMHAVTPVRVPPSRLDPAQRRCYLQLRADGLDVDQAYQATLALDR